MEQAHTRLIAQLKERIAAPDNTPLYLKFAETVKNAVRSGVLAHGNILPGERDQTSWPVCRALRAQSDAGAGRGRRRHPRAWSGAQINNIALNIR